MTHFGIGQPRWHLTRASVCGKSHVDSQLPNQDRLEVLTSADGLVVAAAIADGAGSAARSHVGAAVTCEVMAPCMLDIGIQLQASGISAEAVEERVIRSLEDVRSRLASGGEPIAAFHCTLVACVLTDRGGYVCQVGDSVALTTAFDERTGSDGAELDFFPDGKARLFQPERGQYANETHFVTEADWRSHLRLTPVDTATVDAVLLMTDGAMDVAMVRGKVFRGFLSNLIGKLLMVPAAAERDQILAEWLSDPRTHRATADDKTVLVAIRSEHERLAGRPFTTADEVGEAATEPAPTVANQHASGLSRAHAALPSQRRQSGLLSGAVSAVLPPVQEPSVFTRAQLLVVAMSIMIRDCCSSKGLRPILSPPLAAENGGRPAELIFAPHGRMSVSFPKARQLR